MYGAPYIFYFVHPIVKTVEMMVQRVDFERNLKNICPATVFPFMTSNSNKNMSNNRFFVTFLNTRKQKFIGS